MATWHQTRAAPVKLSHPTQWTVLVDAPHELRCAYTWYGASDAEAFATGYRSRNPGARLTILPPDTI